MDGQGVSKLFGFVEMADEDSMNKAIAALNGKEVNGRVMKVEVSTGRGM